MTPPLASRLRWPGALRSGSGLRSPEHFYAGYDESHRALDLTALARRNTPMIKSTQPMEIQFWPIDKFVFYARNPRKNDIAVDRMCASLREFGFKVPVLARSDGTVVDGHLRLKAARKLGSWPGGDVTAIPVLLCNEWTDAQVRAFRLLVNRSATWADFDEELLALELHELSEADFDLSLTGFDPKDLDDLLIAPEVDEIANAVPPLPENPVSRLGDLWICSDGRTRHRVLCGD